MTNILSTKEIKDSLALALDNVSSKEELISLINDTSEYIGVYKIGFEQFIRFGPSILDPVREIDGKIFLDMKLHDIPNTVANAVKSASEHDVDYLTIHTMGGLAMLEAAKEAALSCAKPPALIGVTLLTSIDQRTLRNDINVNCSVIEYVSHLASLAVEADFSGIVCSAADLKEIGVYLPDEFDVITPGIRTSGDTVGDQKRVATPQSAISDGATILVLGRAVTAAESPRKTAKRIHESVSKLM